MNSSTGGPTRAKPKKKQLCTVSKNGQIRLLAIRLLDQGQLVASLKTYNFKSEPRAPAYEALSYVWGKEPDEKLELPKLQVDCLDCKENGSGSHYLFFDLWPNLHTALLRIMSHVRAGEERILWTDRICIDQGDPDDKKVQVGQMAEVYAEARGVLVWLGEPERGLSEADVARNLVRGRPGVQYRLQDVANRVSQLATTSGPRFDPRGAAGLPPVNDAIWALLSDIVRKDWYRRIWTLQEAVLAPKLAVHYGAHVLPWDDVEHLVNVYGQVPVLRSHDDFQEQGRGERWRFHHVMWVRQYRQLTTPRVVPLTHLLQTSMYKESTDDKDRVYGVLGMCDPSVRAGLVPDYTKSVRQVYIDACRQALQCENKLQLLSLTFERDGRGGLPSWCPDLARWNGCEVQVPVLRSRRPRGKPSVWPTSVNIPDDDGQDRLHIHGFVADTIAAVSHAPFPGIHIREPERRWRLIAAYYRESLAVARAAAAAGGDDDPEFAHWRTLITDRHSWEGSAMTTEEAEIGYRSYFVRKQEDRARQTAEEKRLADTYSAALLTACNRRKFFRTKDTGRVGLAPEACQVGDVVCVFQGALTPHLLRRNIGSDDELDERQDLTEEEETFTFLGDCYVHGLMDSDVIDAYDRGLNLGRRFIVT